MKFTEDKNGITLKVVIFIKVCVGVAWSLSSSSVGLAQFDIRRTRVISFWFFG